MNPFDAFLNDTLEKDFPQEAEAQIQAWQESIQDNLMILGYPTAPYWKGVTLVAVTKHADIYAIQGAVRCGLLAMGENKAVEALAKRNTLPKDVNEAIEWHFIGHIQRNKLNKIVGFYDVIHSVHSLELAEAIAEKARALNIEQSILVQVNTSGEASKQGVDPENLLHLVEKILALSPAVKVVGLMTMAPNTEDFETIDSCFKELKRLKETLETGLGIEVPQLSMGMSNDYSQALANGATIVRIGTKLFA
jgi:pyridoxal phosphate enzyme (YggS family)